MEKLSQDFLLNPALSLLTVPYLGFYNEELYDLIHPEKIYFQQDEQLMKYFPKRMRNAIDKFLETNENTDLKISLITYDASRYRDPNRLSNFATFMMKLEIFDSES